MSCGSGRGRGREPLDAYEQLWLGDSAIIEDEEAEAFKDATELEEEIDEDDEEDEDIRPSAKEDAEFDSDEWDSGLMVALSNDCGSDAAV